MELSVRNWLVAAVLGTVFLGFVFRPVPQPSRFQSNPNYMRDRERQQLVTRLRTIDRRIVERQFADSVIAAVRGVRNGAAPVFDARIPPAERTAIAARAATAMSEVPHAADRIAIAVTIGDRNDISRNTGYLFYVLPDSGTDARCVVVLRVPVRHVGRMTPAQRDAHATSMLRTGIPGFPRTEDLGPCGFYAAFGPPSAEVARTLRAQGWLATASGYAPRTPAPESLWAATPFTRQMFGVLERGDGIVACAAGRQDQCERGVLGAGFSLENRFGGPAPLAPATDVLRAQRAAIWRGNVSLRARFLDHLVREVGPEQFTELWRSPQELSAAYASVAGEPLSAYIERWLKRSIGRAWAGPAVTMRLALIALATALVAVGAAILLHRFRGVS